MRGPVGIESDLKGTRAALGEETDGGGVGLRFGFTSIFTTGSPSREGSTGLGNISSSLSTMSSLSLIMLGEGERRGSL
jgi:hypothetical protein